MPRLEKMEVEEMENIENTLANCSCELRIPEEKIIKMCPFCGGEPEIHEGHTDNGGVEVYYREYHYYTVMCKECGVSITDCYGMDRAIKAWNRRCYD